MTHETSQTEGINSDVLDEEVIEETTEDTQNESDNENKAKSKSNVPKILAEKNKWKAEAEKYKAEAESKEFSKEQVEAMINGAIASREENNLKNQERNNFLESYWEEHVEAVENTLKVHPTLSYEEAANLSGIGNTQPTNPNKFSFAWNTPASIKKAKTTQTLSDDELRASLVDSFQDAWYRNAH